MMKNTMKNDRSRPFYGRSLTQKKIPSLNAFKHFQANLSNSLSILSFLYSINLQLYFVDAQLISKKVMFLWAKTRNFDAKLFVLRFETILFLLLLFLLFLVTIIEGCLLLSSAGKIPSLLPVVIQYCKKRRTVSKSDRTIKVSTIDFVLLICVVYINIPTRG